MMAMMEGMDMMMMEEEKMEDEEKKSEAAAEDGDNCSVGLWIGITAFIIIFICVIVALFVLNKKDDSGEKKWYGI